MFSRGISINRPSTPGQPGGQTIHHSIPHLRWKLPRPGLKSCRRRAEPYQPTSSPTGVFCTSTVSLKGISPWIRLRLDGSLAGARALWYLAPIKSFIDAAPWASYNAVSQMRKARTCSRIYTRGLAVITRHLEPSLEMHSDKVCTSQLQSPTLLS
jgi:hypothetical protein